MYRYAQNNIQLYEQMRRADHDDEDLRQVARAYDFALRLFAGRYRGSGKPFLDHLVGTASVLMRHGAGLPTVLAGLLHAAYRHGEWGTGLHGITKAKHNGLVAAVGSEAEALVARYDNFDFSRLKREPVPQVIASLDPVEREVLFMRIANDLEEAVDCALLYSGPEILAEHLGWLPIFAEAARELGHADIASELEAAHGETTAGKAAENLPGQRRWPHTRAPLSHRMRLRHTVIRVAQAVQRRLPGGLSRR